LGVAGAACYHPAMKPRGYAAAAAAMLMLAACASAPRAARTEFEDIPVPKGLAYQQEDSTIIETPNVKAGRHVYRGRLELDSLTTAIRSTLESNGWRHVSSTKSAEHGTTQVYEKDGDSLQVHLSEGIWYTYAVYTTGRVMKRAK
jgi:hypothetical protein